MNKFKYWLNAAHENDYYTNNRAFAKDCLTLQEAYSESGCDFWGLVDQAPSDIPVGLNSSGISFDVAHAEKQIETVLYS